MKRILFLITVLLTVARITGQDAIIYKLPDGLSPIIDGYIDDLWYMVEEFSIDKPFQTEEPTLDKATWRAVWNDSAMFIMIAVEEDNFCPVWCEPEVADWMSDRTEVYLDVNETLKDGEGPVIQPTSGHYVFWPGFTEGEDQYYFCGQIWQGWNYCYAYEVDGSDYVFEYDIPWSTLKDKNEVVFNPEGGRPIGFDVYVVDRDEGEWDRKRSVWMNDGKGPSNDESWNTMDDCGVVAFEEAWINDSVVCDTGRMSFTVFDVPVDSVTDYLWDADDGVITLSTESNAVIKWNTTGEKNVSLAITKTGGAKDTFRTTITVYAGFSVSLGEDFTVCPNTEFTLTPSTVNGIRPFEYLWNSIPGDSVFEGSRNDTSNIMLRIKDNAGCTVTDNININVSMKSFNEQICMVTVDVATGKNKIVWQKTAGKLTAQYQVLKETTVAGQYSVLGTIPFYNESVFTDTASEPSKHADRYRILTIDSCGNAPSPSGDHQTIHLVLSPGLPGKFNLSWSPYIGFNYNTYYIYKGSTPESLELIDSIAKTKTQYTDDESGIAYYRVAVRREEPCDISVLKSSGNIYSEAGSNIESTLTSNTGSEIIPETSFAILPNPFVDEVFIEYTLQEPSDAGFEIYSLLGTKIYEFRKNNSIPGTYRHVISEESLHNAGNLLIMRIELDKKVYFRKLLKQ
jgi:hypothetical protein